MRRSLVTLLLWCGNAFAADPGRIYTQFDPSSEGGVTGTSNFALSHAIAVGHDRTHVYRGDLSDDGKMFSFVGLPVGKYDLVLVTKDGAAYEGLSLGKPIDALAETAKTNLGKRITLADSFFNRHTVHRCGIEGNIVLALVERIRDKETLKQSGEKLDANIRRVEVLELQRATDDWQMVRTRHIYRDSEKLRSNPPFSRHTFVPALGNIRVVDTIKQLGMLTLPTK